ncbi:unnamed protein product [Rotaria socialis]|uniref:Uncharacterized protein n=1 Tax=Rotaria socialis TaxID=392032 RepID=A0A817UWE4_9BILA|nr:unnamed protein product [Rotaria socialis]CAF3336066.1 unnamed protein product [Rotaria socialis]CAF3557944.1 unnamed protein product [Rotaria socialis]CAF4539417.1 unnamed protein product [Rotaria socialis]
MCEVTSSNFLELFPFITQLIDQSCFLAIDTEFSSVDTFSSSIKTIKQLYEQRSSFVKQITILQFGIAIFSKTSEQQKYDVNIYNFYLNPTSIHPIDVEYSMKSSSIKFLAEFNFDFNKCFYSGISFLNQTQEEILVNQNKSLSNYKFSINEQSFLNILFEKMNAWLITAHVDDEMEYEFDESNKDILNDYLLHFEIRRCFKTIWTTTKIIDDKKILFIHHITKETYEQQLKDNLDNEKNFQIFIQSLTGFTNLIRYIRDSYRKPIVGHNCFLDWLLIYDKFLDNLPPKFEEFQRLLNQNFQSSLFDTKYLALQMKEYLFTRQNRSNISNYIDKLTTATSLSSLYDLLTSKYYDSLIFLKPIIEINSTNQFQYQVRKHEAGYDAFMSGIIFLKMIYLYKQKHFNNKLDFNEHQSIFDICLNEIQIFKNRFYSTFLPFISLNRYDTNKIFKKKTLQQCLVIQKHSKERIDLPDIITKFNAYCTMEYEVNRNLNKIYLLFQSERCQRQILQDYIDDPLYKIEKFNWFKHSLVVKYSFGISIVMTGICIAFLLKKRQI